MTTRDANSSSSSSSETVDPEVSPTPAEHPLTTTRKIHVLVAEIRRCLDTDKMLAAYRKLDAIDDLLAGVVPHASQERTK